MFIPISLGLVDKVLEVYGVVYTGSFLLKCRNWSHQNSEATCHVRDFIKGLFPSGAQLDDVDEWGRGQAFSRKFSSG